jgi:D-serine deaminase-like pyridoxal phosphate-dependent protein
LLSKLTKPTLLLDAQKCRRNILRMQQKAEAQNVIFRPHFKTHQSATIAQWFAEVGTHKITVSSVSMAQYFASHGWSNILIAFPLNLAEIDHFTRLAAEIRLSVLVENTEAIRALSSASIRNIDVYLKIDTGYHRTGVPVEDCEQVQRLIDAIDKQPSLRFRGFVVHNGQTYHTSHPQQVIDIHHRSVEALIKLRRKITSQSESILISMGDTPSMSLVEDFTGVDEIRPGNFVFYDVMQQQIGACTYDDIAVALACPVVAIHKQHNEITLYGGAIHLSKEYIDDADGIPIYGKIVSLTGNGWSDPWPESYMKVLSQEHGIVRTNTEMINQISIGDFIGILPIHSCLTTHLMRDMITTTGQTITTMQNIK